MCFIFSRKTSKSIVLQYLVLYSITDCLLLIILILDPIAIVAVFSINSYLLSVFNKLAVLFYAARAMSFLSSFINIKISIDRLWIVKRIEANQLHAKKNSVFTGIVSSFVWYFSAENFRIKNRSNQL